MNYQVIKDGYKRENLWFHLFKDYKQAKLTYGMKQHISDRG